MLPRASATSATSSTSAPRPGRSTSPRTVVAAARATTGSISPPVWTARPSRRSSPTRSAAATTPTPSPPPACSTSTTRSSNFTGALTSGSATVTGISSTTGLVVGGGVTGTGIPAGTTILAINSFTDTITLSANATAGGVQSLTASWEVGQHHLDNHPEPGVLHLRPELQPDGRHRQLGHAQPGDHPVLDRRRLAISDPQQSERPRGRLSPGAVRRRG